MKELLKNTIKNLERNNISGYYVTNKEELLLLLQSLLKEDEVIGCGDSVTIEDLQVFDFLRKGKYQFLDKHLPELNKSEKREIYLQNFRADTFVSGVNAVSENGELYFIDGNGSRVAPVIYGPKQVILITGTNKLTTGSEEAAERVRQIAAPLDARRLGKNTPCAKLGKCVNCRSSERICNSFVRIARQFDKERMKVIFVEGSFGY